MTYSRNLLTTSALMLGLAVGVGYSNSTQAADNVYNGPVQQNTTNDRTNNFELNINAPDFSGVVEWFKDCLKPKKPKSHIYFPRQRRGLIKNLGELGGKFNEACPKDADNQGYVRFDSKELVFETGDKDGLAIKIIRTYSQDSHKLEFTTDTKGEKGKYTVDVVTGIDKRVFEIRVTDPDGNSRLYTREGMELPAPIIEPQQPRRIEKLGPQFIPKPLKPNESPIYIPALVPTA